MTRVFVYGTLKRRGSNHACLAGQKFIAEARTSPGFTLLGLGDFPGMVRSATGAVEGEVWEVDSGCLSGLDKLEEVGTGLYERVPISLAPPYPADESVHAYLYLGSAEGRPPLGASWPV